jgi:hypothetical protein
MDYTYSFEDHLREHRPSRLGQRLWWMPAAGGVGVVIGSGTYLAATPSAQLSPTLGGALPCIAAFLFLLAWAALSIADWTYPSEKRYREAHHAAASQIRAYILAGRRSRGEAHIPPKTNERRVAPSGSDAADLRGDASTPHPSLHPGSAARQGSAGLASGRPSGLA